MNRKPLGTLESPESKKLRERATNCHRLAAAVGNLEFAVKLEAIAGEYEARAGQAEDTRRPRQNSKTALVDGGKD